MSDFGDVQPRLNLKATAFGLVLFLATLGIAVLVRSMVPDRRPAHANAATAEAPRAIVEILRPQNGLPDLSGLVSRLCPSIAVVVPRGGTAEPASGKAALPAASVYSTDGWLATSGANLPEGPLDALFGDGTRVPVTDQRSDPVSGLAVVKTASQAGALTFSDQVFPQVGQFGLMVQTVRGTGCSAALAMIGSDFIADGAAGSGYVRLQPPPAAWAPGMPVVGNDGQLLGIAAAGPNGTVVPASIASVIVDELVRGSIAPSAAFGFRAIDFDASVSRRLGDLRSGAAVALVEPKSGAARAGLQAGDIVLGIDDSPVSSASELNRLLDVAKRRVRLRVQRGSDSFTLMVRKLSSG